MLRRRFHGLTADNSDLNVRVTDLGTMVELPTDTLFAFDSAELGPEAEPKLLKATELVRRGGPGSVGVVGHTDANGGDA